MPEVRVCKKGDIAEGGTRLVRSGPVEIGVIFHKGAYYAYRNLCPHQGGPACEGLKIPQVVEKIGEKGIHLGQVFDENDMHIICPWHGWEFHLKDGVRVIDTRHRLKKYPVVERGGDILARQIAKIAVRRSSARTPSATFSAAMPSACSSSIRSFRR